MIRKAELRDAKKITDLLQRFHSQSNQPQEFIFADMFSFIEEMIETQIVIVGDSSVICGIVVASPLNSNWRTSMELYWYAEDGSGVRLLTAFEKASKKMGADEVRLAHFVQNPKVGRYLIKKGYCLDEIVYSRRT